MYNLFHSGVMNLTTGACVNIDVEQDKMAGGDAVSNGECAVYLCSHE